MAQQTRKPLSQIARQVAECYAAIYPEAPARTKAMQWLNVARRAVNGEKGLQSVQVSAAVEELVAAGVLEPSVESQRGVTARGPRARPESLVHFCEGAFERGFYPIILRELEASEFQPFYARNKSVIPVRFAGQYARYALISNTFEHFANEDFDPGVWLWLTHDDAARYLPRLPEPHRHEACITGMRYLVYCLLPFEAFATTCSAFESSDTQRLVIARGRVFQGAFNDALALVDEVEQSASVAKPDRVECQSIRALIATLKGDDEAACTYIEAAIAEERSGTRKRIVYPNTLCFGFAMFSLIRVGTPSSRALFKSLLEAREKLKLHSDIDWPFMAASSADLPATGMKSRYPNEAPTVLGALYAICSRWHKDYHHPQDHEGVQAWLGRILDAAYAGGFNWVAAEIQTVMEANVSDDKKRASLIDNQFQNIAASTRHEQLGTRSLTHLVTPMEPWEYTLRELEQLALKSTPAKHKAEKTTKGPSRRLVWHLTETFDKHVEVNPIEQSLGKNGQWSAGRRVALKRLREEAPSIEHLIEQDVKASATIQKLDYGWGSTTYETDQRTVFQLQGHPCVFDDDGERIDIVEQPPMLTLADLAGARKLMLEPAFNGAHYRTRLEHEQRRVYVTHFTAAHRRIAEVVPVGGLLVPAIASERLQSMLDALSSDINVQGDSDTAGGNVQAGSPIPLLAMEPFGSSLRIRIRVEPLPESGTFFDAATGGAVVYVQTANGTVTVQRELQEERHQVETMVLSSSVLAQHYDGRSFFVIDEVTDALELLEDVQAAGVRCLWPSDIPFRIKARADISNVSLNIKSAKEWFTASGTLAVNADDPLSLAHLLRLMQAQPKSRFIELGKGEFLALSSTLKQQLDTLQAFVKTERTETDTNKVHPMALLSLDPLLDNAKLKTDKALKNRREQINKALKSTATVPPSLQAELRTYQHEGFAWLERLGQLGAGACLADDMGLGKTVQSLALLLARADGGPALVVAPTSVVGNWLQEAQRFAPSLQVFSYADSELGRQEILDDIGPYDVVVISYGLLVNDMEHLQKIHWHSVILDEAQAIKNASTRRARSVKQLSADFRVVTTGTPVQNNLMDLHSLFSFLNPKLLGSEAEFRQRYALPISRDNNEHAREQLQKLVSPFLLRRHKRDVLQELPARTELTLNVSLSKEEAALYELIRKEALDSLKDSDKAKGAGAKNDQKSGQQKIIILSYLTKLRRLCCNPSLVSPGWTGPMSKLDVFTDTLSELIASGHKALVFSQFVDHLKIVEASLKKQSISYQYLDGSTTARKRTASVSAFQAGEGDVFLISLTAGGTGLNLTAADYVIHLDPWWNPAVEDQASDRAHRLGQQRPVTIVRMVTTGTIEEQIQTLHGTKRDLADSVLSGADSPMLDVDTMIRLLRG